MSRTMQSDTCSFRRRSTVTLWLTACRATPSTPLGSAAFRGDVAAVKALLDTQSADTAADSWTPLIWAARAGRVDVMTLLLDAGADPNRRDTRHGWTPLMHAQHVKQEGAARCCWPAARTALAERGHQPAGDGGSRQRRRDAPCAAGSPPSTRTAGSGVRPCGLGRRVGRPGSAAARRVPDRGRHGPAGLRQNLGRVQDGLGSPLWWARRQGCHGDDRQVADANTKNSAQKAP